jgi:hypothetical protein
LQKIQLLKTVFNIGKAGTGCDILLFEIGEEYCCYALLKGEDRSFHQIKYISYDGLNSKNHLAAIFDELKNESCAKVFISCAFSQALLVPIKYANNQQALLNAVYDQSFQNCLSDTIPEWQISVAYSIPAYVFSLINERFPSVQILHSYTPALKVYNGFAASNQIDIHFNRERFRVLVKKNKQVQLAQTYSYKTPLDESEVLLVVSGLIDKDSAMYTELHNYFLNLHVAEAPTYSLPENDHPHHYFTSLYNLATCVS